MGQKDPLRNPFHHRADSTDGSVLGGLASESVEMPEPERTGTGGTGFGTGTGGTGTGSCRNRIEPNRTVGFLRLVSHG